MLFLDARKKDSIQSSASAEDSRGMAPKWQKKQLFSHSESVSGTTEGFRSEKVSGTPKGLRVHDLQLRARLFRISYVAAGTLAEVSPHHFTIWSKPLLLVHGGLQVRAAGGLACRGYLGERIHLVQGPGALLLTGKTGANDAKHALDSRRGCHSSLRAACLQTTTAEAKTNPLLKGTGIGHWTPAVSLSHGQHPGHASGATGRHQVQLDH